MTYENKHIKFGMNFGLQGRLGDMVEWWQAAEEAGMDQLGIPDSPVQWPELYVCSSLCALNTKKSQIVSCVTNPTTRHPSVTASALFSLDEIAPGRIALGIATGDSALWGVGLKSSTVARLREYILAVKGMLRGEEVQYLGNSFKPEWRHWSPPKEIPVYVACSGPKVLKMTSQVADGAMVAMGFGPDNIEYVNSIIREGCAEVGRNPDEIEICMQGGSPIFANSKEEARASGGVGANIRWLVMGGMEGKQIPEEMKEPLRKLEEGQRTFSGGYQNPNWMRDLSTKAKELGLWDWLQSRAAHVGGTTDDVVARYEEFRDLGITSWMQTILDFGGSIDRFKMIDRMGEVIKRIR